CAVICTAPMSGGTRNGSRITTSSSSANRVRITRALKSVPTATNPSVASAMRPMSGTSTGPTGTSKNRTNSGSPTASTTSTNTPLPGDRPTLLLRDSAAFPPAPPREVNEPAVPLERHVGSELGPLADVVHRQHDHATCRAPAPAAQLAEERPELGRRREIEPRERLVEEQDGRIVDQGLGDRRALRQT